jgi:hypothetical protein
MTMVVIELAVCPAICLAGSYKYPPCYSIFESKLRGWCLYRVSVEPEVIVWKGKQIKIKEAWLEQAHERVLLGWKKASHYNLCVNLATGWDVLWDITGNEPFFVLEGQRQSFGMMGSAVLFTRLETIESTEFNVLLTDNWRFENATRIKLKIVKARSVERK